MVMRTVLIIALGAISLSVALAASASRFAEARSKLQVVAAENVYGDIASQIGGPRIHVTSILSDPNADPHLFEPGTRNGLAVAEAKLLIQNGLGYDAFMTRLANASPSKSRVVVTIADVLGVRGRAANPHLWYDVPKLSRVAGAIAAALVRADPAGRATYRAGLRRFVSRCSPLQAEVRLIRTRFGGSAVAYTEPVPGYLLAAANLRNLAPPAFTRAIEDGSEPPPAAVAAMTSLMSGRRIKVLLYNDQTVSPITSRIRSAAIAHHIPVVGVSETLPPHLSFQQWQLQQARTLASALAG
jgi:zinc/manganese transport system substrate-binding protein